MRIQTLAVGFMLLSGSTVGAQTTRATPEACAALMQLQVPGVALTVTRTEWLAAGAPIPGGRGGAPVASNLPAYCRLDGAIDRRTGAAGVAYAIGFALALPENWNGRFLFQGGGGLNGSVQPPLGGSAAGGESGLARGFAVVSTDTGHQGTGGFDGSFMQDQQASLDFAYAAIGRVADVAKRIIAQHYGKPPDRSYFAGCSTGGREAMLMTQRYPRYFDGVVAGAPAMRTSFSGIGDRWVAATLNEIAPKNAQGQPVTRDALSDSDKKTVLDGLTNACDAGDGLKDGLIFNINAADSIRRCWPARAQKPMAACRWRKRRRSRRRSPVRRTRRAARSIRDSSSTPASPPRRASRDCCMAAQIPSARHSPTSAWTSMPQSTRRSADPAESLSATSHGPT